MSVLKPQIAYDCLQKEEIFIRIEDSSLLNDFYSGLNCFNSDYNL